MTVFICSISLYKQTFKVHGLLHAHKSYIYYINQGIIDVANCVNWRAKYRVDGTDTIIF